MFALVTFVFVLVNVLTEAYPVEDLVENLPSYGPPPTTHYSGYLDATSGCDVKANGPECKVHYWFASAKSNPSDAPTVVWTNGGPGASGLLGFFEEQGPLLIDAKGGLMENPWSWTNVANFLVLEAPVGVGFSYCDNMRNGKPCKNTDRTTASASRAALEDFYRKFPELASNHLYLTGESYAGVYVPTLAKEILDNTDLPLNGVAVGDPCTDDESQDLSMDSLWYANKYGLMDNDDYELLTTKCDVKYFHNLMPRGGLFKAINDLNMKLSAIHDLKKRRVHAKKLFDTIVMNGAHRKIKEVKDSNLKKECLVAYRKFLMSSSNGLSQGWKHLYIDDYSLFAPVSNLQNEFMTKYLNRADVRKALNVDDSPVKEWFWVGEWKSFRYKSEYKACNDKPIVDKSMVDIYREIIPKLSRTWIYNGDTDPCVSYEGTREAVKKIGRKEVEGGSYRPWFYNQANVSLYVLEEKAATFGPNLSYQDLGAQFAGEVVDYEDGLSFVTFHGSGHMVPQFRPQAALHFLKVFLDEDRRLSPLLPSDDALASSKDSDFDNSVFDKWAEKAMSHSYFE